MIFSANTPHDLSKRIVELVRINNFDRPEKFTPGLKFLLPLRNTFPTSREAGRNNFSIREAKKINREAKNCQSKQS